MNETIFKFENISLTGEIDEEGKAIIASHIIDLLRKLYKREHPDYPDYVQEQVPTEWLQFAISWSRDEVRVRYTIDALDDIPDFWSPKTSRGSFVKRLQRLLYTELKIKIDPTFLSNIGSIFTEHLTDANKWDIQMIETLDENLGFEAGEFKDKGSCYFKFDMQQYANQYFIPDVGILLMVVSTEGSKGRAWCFKDEQFEDNMYVLYNGYGVSLLKIAMLLSVALQNKGYNVTYKKFPATNSHDKDDIQYVNGDIVYIISTQQNLDRISEIGIYDFQLDTHKYYERWQEKRAEAEEKEEAEYTVCYRCDTRIYNGEEIYVEGYCYCRNCFDNDLSNGVIVLPANKNEYYYEENDNIYYVENDYYYLPNARVFSAYTIYPRDDIAFQRIDEDVIINNNDELFFWHSNNPIYDLVITEDTYTYVLKEDISDYLEGFNVPAYVWKDRNFKQSDVEIVDYILSQMYKAKAI